MAFQAPVETSSGKIRELTLGAQKTVVVGGQNALAFHGFEGTLPNAPRIALEVYDTAPADWAEELKRVLGDVWADPVAWAKKCEGEFGADMVCLQLAGTDPNGANRSAADAVATVKAVADAISVPLIVYGSGNTEKDAEVLKAVAEATQGKNVVIGVAVEENYKSVGEAAMGFGAKVSGETPIDVNMAKQLNILLTNLGVSMDKILMDPSTGALGYGIEYTYSVMERDRLTALKQGDDKMQLPLICDVAKYCWKTREAGIPQAEEPTFGDAKVRGVLWETTTAADLLAAGADVLILRHPESVRIMKKIIDDVMA